MWGKSLNIDQLAKNLRKVVGGRALPDWQVVDIDKKNGEKLRFRPRDAGKDFRKRKKISGKEEWVSGKEEWVSGKEEWVSGKDFQIPEKNGKVAHHVSAEKTRPLSRRYSTTPEERNRT
jgi:hypothetical protein